MQKLASLRSQVSICMFLKAGLSALGLFLTLTPYSAAYAQALQNHDEECRLAIDDAFNMKVVSWAQKSYLLSNRGEENLLDNGINGETARNHRFSVSNIREAPERANLLSSNAAECRADFTWFRDRYIEGYEVGPRVEARSVRYTVVSSPGGISWQDIIVPPDERIFWNGKSLAQIRNEERQESARLAGIQAASKRRSDAIGRFWSPLGDCRRWNRMCRMYEQNQVELPAWTAFYQNVWQIWDRSGLSVSNRVARKAVIMDALNDSLKDCQTLAGLYLQNCQSGIFNSNNNYLNNN